MTNYLPDKVIKIGIPLILALIPLIGTLSTSQIFENPELSLTVLERLEHQQNTSFLEIIIQNIGNAPSNDIILLFDFDNSYEIISTKTTDKEPKIMQENNKLRLNIERLAPQAYVVINAQDTIFNEDKRFWVTTDKDTKIITLPNSGTSSGISTVHITKEKDEKYLAVAGFGFAAVFAFRYYRFYRSESLRRAFLGIHQIKIVRYSSNLGVGIMVIFGAVGVGAMIDGVLEPNPIQDYTQYDAFQLDNKISYETFIRINEDPVNVLGSNPGIGIVVIGIFIALFSSTKDINLPSFIWSLKPHRSQVKLKEIPASYLSAQEISITTQKKLSEIDTEIFAVKENNEIVGLISKKVAEKEVDGKTSLKSVFNETSRSTKRKKLKIDRNNFAVVSEELDLESLKKELELSNKKYAVIENSEKKFVGVINYEDLFAEPSIFQK